MVNGGVDVLIFEVIVVMLLGVICIVYRSFVF